MPNYSFLIKPASGNCNMACEYCFYADEASLREVKSYGIMDKSTLENVVIKLINNSETSCSFAFQGGEPTLAGIDYFYNLSELVEKYNTRNIKVNYAIQTNGILINDEWAAYFKKYNFLVGISLDGSKDIHNMNRLNRLGYGTYSNVINAIKILKKYKVDYNILTVITKQAARHTEKIYRFLLKNNFVYQQYIPCLDPLESERGEMAYSLTPEAYGDFLIKLFDLWYTDIVNGKQIYIRYFENLVGMLMGQYPELCGMAGSCSIQFVVEANGSVYPCDFYALDEYYMGNLNTNSFEEVLNNSKNINFVEKSRQTSKQCKECKWFNICRGGCRRDRDFASSNELSLSYFCPAYKRFFEHAYPGLSNIALQLMKR